MTPTDYTVVIAVDRQHSQELRTVLPTWQRYRPDVLERPLLLLYDEHATDTRFITGIGKWQGPISTQSVPAMRNLPQRDRMLTALTILPAHLVMTPYWLKIDTDVIATGPSEFPPMLFENRPAIVASPWGYSKPPGVLIAMNAWANDLEYCGVAAWKNPPIEGTIEHDRVRHRRVISWLSFLRTDWTQRTVDLLGDTIEEQMANLPVRSHDTFYSYVAQRQGQAIRTIRFKKYGWDHVRPRNLAARVAEVLK